MKKGKSFVIAMALGLFLITPAYAEGTATPNNTNAATTNGANNGYNTTRTYAADDNNRNIDWGWLGLLGLLGLAGMRNRSRENHK